MIIFITSKSLNNVSLIYQDKIRLWDESIKCLFLRARDPRGEVFDNLVTKIFQVKLHSDVAKSYLEKTRKFFTDFRNKFNQSISSNVEKFKEIRKSRYLFNCFVANQIVLQLYNYQFNYRASTGSLSQRELKDYVDENLVLTILSRQLVAVNISELSSTGGFDTLVDFVRETFKVSWNGKNLSAVKELDSMTKTLKIPSRSGSKVVDSLSVSYFIYTDTSLRIF